MDWLVQQGLEKLGDVFKDFLILMCMLWFKFILGCGLNLSLFFELVSISFGIVPDYGNEYTTKESKIETVLTILHQNLI